jgi:outer membrane protein OmpA-like peptidoglycan-associated protein
MVPNNYIVFFDFDRSSVTQEADRVLAAAVDNAKQAQVTKIEVTGHADRSGSVKYNQRLSQRRADVVKSALVAKGIPADQIEVIAKGEGDPLVATKDGVREAQNRRVQVILK